MKRQGLITTIGQLRRIANDLEKGEREFYENLGHLDFPEYAVINQVQFQVNIINAEGLSDSWEIEEFFKNKRRYSMCSKEIIIKEEQEKGNGKI